MRSLKLLLVVILISLISYTYGVITVKNRVFPYYQLKSLSRVFNLNNHNKSIKNNIPSKIKESVKIDAHFEHRKTFFEKHSQSDYDIVFIGDSFTEYVEWGDLFPTMKIANRGIKGDTTEGVLSRLESIYATNASKAFIMIGINDFTSGKNLLEVFKNYQKIVSKIALYDIPVYIQSTLLAGEDMEKLNKKIILLNKKLRNLADQNKLIKYIDLNKELAPRSFLDPKYSSDQMHLNGDGYDVWRRIIESSVVYKR